MMAIIGTLAFNFQTVPALLFRRDLGGGNGSFSLDDVRGQRRLAWPAPYRRSPHDDVSVPAR